MQTSLVLAEGGKPQHVPQVVQRLAFKRGKKSALWCSQMV